MSQPQQSPDRSMPMPWVDKIFDKLTLVYGQTFLRRWADIDLAAVKADWAHELAGFTHHPSSIAWALQHLPADKPPTVLEFRLLARKAPPEVLPQLEAPKADPAVIAAVVAGLSPSIREPRGDDGKEWARRLLSKHANGFKVPRISLRFAREALGIQAQPTEAA